MERKQDALNELNLIRTLHEIPTVPYDSSADVATQKSALLMSANSDIEHEPPGWWHCWTQAGFDAASSSNLSILWSTSGGDLVTPEEEIIGWLIDNNVPSLGHRRWLLDPFLYGISFGSVAGIALVNTDYPWSHASVLQVIWEENANIAQVVTPKVVAYPFGDYPTEYVNKDWYLSASILIDAESRWANEEIYFDNTQISVTGPSGPMTVYDVDFNNSWYGLPNNIQWKVQGLQDGVQYNVTFQPVNVQGNNQTFNYSFRLL
jgi:hypothetical protein